MAEHEVWIWDIPEGHYQARCDTCTWKGKTHIVRPGVTPLGAMMAAQTDKRTHQTRTS